MEYILPLVEFPAHIAVSHLVASQWFPFYSKFTEVQKYEWLAWTSTVMFQTTFTAFYLFDWAPLSLGLYFLGHVAYDTAFLAFYSDDRLLYLHHGLSVVLCVSMNWIGGEIVREASIAAALLERSNILIGFVWLLNRAGYGKTWVVQSVGAAALVTYIALRLFYFPRYIFFVASWETMALMSVFVPMNVFWSWKMAMYYYRVAFATKEGAVRLE